MASSSPSSSYALHPAHIRLQRRSRSHPGFTNDHQFLSAFSGSQYCQISWFVFNLELLRLAKGMAEVVGLVASVAGLLQLTGQVAAFGYGYLSGVKRAPKDLQELSKELASLSLVLMSLQGLVDANPQFETLQKLNKKDGPLQECSSELKILLSKMEPKDGLKGFFSSLKWPLKEAETLQHISRIGRHRDLFNHALSIDHLSLSKEIETYTHETNLIVHEIQTTSVALDSWTQKEDTLRVDEHRKRVLNWLYSGDFDRKHIEVRNKRQKGTGAWLLKEPKFLKWAGNQPDSRLLWGYGIPGAGKTFLSSVVIDYLESRALTEKLGVAYIYFNYDEQYQQGPVRALSSLAKQLACQLPHLPSEIEKLHDRLASREKKPTLDDLYIILLAISKSFTQAFIIIDALDECDQEDQRSEFLPLFHRLGGDGVNLFVTSRQHPEDIQESFQNIARTELSAQEEDITVYVQQKIDGNPRARHLVRQGKLQDRIISDLVDCANGMFLLVRLHIEYICQQTSAKQILNALSSLKNVSKKNPLDPTYDRIMDTIHNQPESCTELALGILSWLTKAQRVLTIHEIQTAVAVEPDSYELDELDLAHKATILDVCAGLVMIDESNNIRLIHYTVQEYLTKKDIIPGDADFTIALSCVTYLSFDAFDGACKGQDTFLARLRSYPFLNYTSRYLGLHLGACDENLTVDSVLRLLRSPGHIMSYLQALNNRDDHGLEGLMFFDSYRKDLSPLHVASRLGHCAAFQQLLKEGADIWVRDRDGATVLHHTAMGGNGRMARFILDNGFPGSAIAMGLGRRTALFMAASWGNEGVARILIEDGADIHVKDFCGYSLGCVAASEGHHDVIKLLIEKGSDLAFSGTNGYTPLHEAVERGHEEAFKLLVENMKVADLSIRTDDGDTALDLAFRKDSYVMVKQLVEGGADLSIGRGSPALFKAASRGWEGIVQLMLDRGADVSAVSGSGKTALDIAISKGHLAVVTKLEAVLGTQKKHCQP